MSKDRSALLASLGLEAQNAGACAAPDDWRGGGPNLASVSPSDESPIASVATATTADCEVVLASAVAAAHAWRDVPLGGHLITLPSVLRGTASGQITLRRIDGWRKIATCSVSVR